VAVDTAGGVYVIDVGGDVGRVYKLPAGSDSPVELSFDGLKNSAGIAVDAAGNVYVTDNTTIECSTSGEVTGPFSYPQ